jgi:hypothetical protein
VEEIEETEAAEEEETLDAEKAIPEKAYLSQRTVVPSFNRLSMVDLIIIRY